MASKRKATPVVYGPEQRSDVIVAAWQGLYHLFGMRWESVEIREDGLYISNLTGGDGYDFRTILDDLSTSKHRVPLLPTINWIMGEAPASFTTPAQLTAWVTQFMKSPGRGKSPQYAKDAVAAYKAANPDVFTAKRGRPRSIKPINIGEINEALLEGVDPSELEQLQATIDSVKGKSEAVEA